MELGELMQTWAQILLAPLLTGIMLGYWNRKQSGRLKQREQREAEQLESELKRIDLEVATAQLSYAAAIALRDGRTNGEMQRAIAAYEEAMGKFREVERKHMALSGMERDAE